MHDPHNLIYGVDILILWKDTRLRYMAKCLMMYILLITAQEGDGLMTTEHLHKMSGVSVGTITDRKKKYLHALMDAGYLEAEKKQYRNKSNSRAWHIYPIRIKPHVRSDLLYGINLRTLWFDRRISHLQKYFMTHLILLANEHGEGAMSAKYLSEQTGTAIGNVGKHLEALRDAGYILAEIRSSCYHSQSGLLLQHKTWNVHIQRQAQSFTK